MLNHLDASLGSGTSVLIGPQNCQKSIPTKSLKDEIPSHLSTGQSEALLAQFLFETALKNSLETEIQLVKWGKIEKKGFRNLETELDSANLRSSTKTG